MKIGMMLRSIDEKGGIGVYTKNLVDELLNIDQKNEYIFFYKTAANLGKYKNINNVKEVFIEGKNKLIWDQFLIPKYAEREKIDIIFNPKFTLPLRGKFKKIMVVHGADWFIPDHAKYYNKYDVFYIKKMMPLYFKAADKVISVSEITTENFNKILDLPDGKVKTIYFGPAKFFKRIEDLNLINTVRKKYNLPSKFIFTLSRYGAGGGLRKNIDKIFDAFKKIYEKDKSVLLVIGGKNTVNYLKDLNLLDEKFIKNIYFPDWIDQQDLPAIYSMCELYLYPSNVEAFPIPITEAMKCGTPIITSNANGLKEIAGGAAIFVDPNDPAEIADSVLALYNNEDLKTDLGKKGLKRSEKFSWETCAKNTLHEIELVYNS